MKIYHRQHVFEVNDMKRANWQVESWTLPSLNAIVFYGQQRPFSTMGDIGEHSLGKLLQMFHYNCSQPAKRQPAKCDVTRKLFHSLSINIIISDIR